MASLYPPVGSWFVDSETEQMFEVVAIDEKHQTVEIQYYDGALTEYDLENWDSLFLKPTEAPEDAYASCDSVTATDDGFNSDSDYYYYNSSNPLDNFEPESFSGFDDLFN